MSAVPPSPPPQTPALVRGSSSSSPPPGPQLQPTDHKLTYCENGVPVTKSKLCFEALLTELSALSQGRSDGAVVERVEIVLCGERLREQQCEALASKIGSSIPLTKVCSLLLSLCSVTLHAFQPLHVTLLQVSFECNYRFNRDLRIWEPIVAQALTGDAGLKALLKSIGKNQVSYDCAFSPNDAAFM